MARVRILVTGATGFVAPFVVRAARARGHEVVTTARSGGDVVAAFDSPDAIDALLAQVQPDVVIHLAALSSVAACEADLDLATHVNSGSSSRFAERLGSRCLFVSTDLVFDGRAAPYGPEAAVSPLSVYGVTKAMGEMLVRCSGGRVVRLPLLFGPDERGRGATASLRKALLARQRPPLFTNEYRTPLHAADAANGLVELVVEPDGPGLVHLAGPERVSRWELGVRFARRHRLDVGLLQAVECLEPLRPRDVALTSDVPFRPLDEMLAEG
jgi:dTDP-4-dehydrorhamnose reductase